MPTKFSSEAEAKGQANNQAVPTMDVPAIAFPAGTAITVTQSTPPDPSLTPEDKAKIALAMMNKALEEPVVAKPSAKPSAKRTLQLPPGSTESVEMPPAVAKTQAASEEKRNDSVSEKVGKNDKATDKESSNKKEISGVKTPGEEKSDSKETPEHENKKPDAKDAASKADETSKAEDTGNVENDNSGVQTALDKKTISEDPGNKEKVVTEEPTKEAAVETDDKNDDDSDSDASTTEHVETEVIETKEGNIVTIEVIEKRTWFRPPKSPKKKKKQKNIIDEISISEKLAKETEAIQNRYWNEFKAAEFWSDCLEQWFASIELSNDPDYKNETYSVKALLRDGLLSALPLSYLSNLMPSAAMRTQMADFEYESPSKSPLTSIHNLPIPKELPFRFWILHLRGKSSRSSIEGPMKDVIGLLQKQFHDMGPEEIKVVEEGLMDGIAHNLCIYAFDKNGVPALAGFIQYYSADDASFVNWLVVDSTPHPAQLYGSFFPAKSSFRDCGIGTWLLMLVQIHAVLFDRSKRIVLQANEGFPAYKFYIKRGFKKVKTNSLESIDGVEGNPFPDDWNVYFVSDEEQDKIRVDQRLQLLSLSRYISTTRGEKEEDFFLLTNQQNLLPTDENKLLLVFPFSVPVASLEKMVDKQSGISIMGMSRFLHSTTGGKYFAIRPQKTSRSLQHAGEFDMRNNYMTARVHTADYTEIKTKPTCFLNDIHLNFCFSLIFRDKKSTSTQGTAIVQPYVSEAVKQLFTIISEKQKNWYSELKTHLKYCCDFLYGHPDLLEKRLIFFVLNPDRRHWNGFCAVNAWIHLLRSDAQLMAPTSKNSKAAKLPKTGLDEYVSGVLFNDGLSSSIKGHGYASDMRPFLWFLNLAVKYRDMRLHKTVSGFDPERLINTHLMKEVGGKQCPVRHFFLLGCEGPFGNIFNQGLDNMPFPFLDRHQSTITKQSDGFNCALAWVLFIIDTMVAFQNRSSKRKKKKDGSLETDKEFFSRLQLGRLTNLPEYLEIEDDHWPPTGDPVYERQGKVNSMIYTLMRHEICFVMERMRVHWLSCADTSSPRPDNSISQSPVDWGEFSSYIEEMHKSAAFKEHIEPMLSVLQAKHRPAQTNAFKDEDKIRQLITSPKHLKPLVDTKIYFDYEEYAKSLNREVVLGNITKEHPIYVYFEDPFGIYHPANPEDYEVMPDHLIAAYVYQRQEKQAPPRPDGEDGADKAEEKVRNGHKENPVEVDAEVVETTDDEDKPAADAKAIKKQPKNPTRFGPGSNEKTRLQVLEELDKTLEEDGVLEEDEETDDEDDDFRPGKGKNSKNKSKHRRIRTSDDESEEDDPQEATDEATDDPKARFLAEVDKDAAKERPEIRIDQYATMNLDDAIWEYLDRQRLLDFIDPQLEMTSYNKVSEKTRKFLEYISVSKTDRAVHRYVITAHTKLDKKLTKLKEKANKASSSARSSKAKKARRQKRQTGLEEYMVEGETYIDRGLEKRLIKTVQKYQPGTAETTMNGRTKIPESKRKEQYKNVTNAKYPKKAPRTRNYNFRERIEEDGWSFLTPDQQASLRFNIINNFDDKHLAQNYMPALQKTDREYLEIFMDEAKAEEMFPIPSELLETETSYSAAREKVGELLNEPTAEDLKALKKRRLKTLQSRISNMKTYKTAVKPKADLEADLMLFDAAKELAWVPSDADDHTLEEIATKEMLEGHYEVKVMRQNGETQVVKPLSDWVEDNFKHVLLGLVQRVAYTALHAFKEKDKDGNESEPITGFVDVSASGVEVKLDDTVINRLKYVKQETLPGKDGEPDVIIDAHWLGWNDEKGISVDLDDKWVEENFLPAYLDRCKRNSGKGSKFVPIPTGDSRQHTITTAQMEIPFVHGPPAQYQQKDGERTCVGKSLANALNYCGLRQDASEVDSVAKSFESKSQSFDGLVKWFCNRNRLKRDIDAKPKSEVFQDIFRNKRIICLVTMCGSDGKSDHCVAITNGWVFDSNIPSALPLCRESFDTVCSSDNQKCEFRKAVRIATIDISTLLRKKIATIPKAESKKRKRGGSKRSNRRGRKKTAG